MIHNLKKRTFAVAGFIGLAIITNAVKPAAEASAHTVSDANIAAIVSVAGNLDIAYGKIAMSKSENKMVREFAQRMITDHSAIQKGAEDLLGKLGVKPEEDHTSRGLAENGVKVKAKLNALNGDAFDRYYIDNEVEYHELVVDATAKLLIPNAKNPELKSTLQSVLPLFKRHLEHARMIQGKLNGMAKSGSDEITDANIGAIVTVAGGLDIAYGTIALEKSKNKMIKEFAKRMVTDHNAVQNAVNELAGKLGLVPAENETSRGLAANGVEVKAKLASLKGKEFDKYYIDNEVAYHELVVNATANILIPNAKNPELKQALVQTLPLFERHLEHAKMVQRQISGKSGSGMMNH